MITACTALGDLHGTQEGGVAVFRGVPYAMPPVRALRFMPPEPVRSWHGLRDATRHGAIAPQGVSRLRAVMGDFNRPQDEDCLTLTIWTPAADAVSRPVMVWLHGGAWLSGAGSLDWYNGARLALEGGIVVVCVNYRLGALGYLYHPAIGPGNVGTLDQIAALAWVRDHIGAFGGNPQQVTVAGQSAGAANIGNLLTRPSVRRLFRRVVVQSGGFGRPPGHPERAIARAERYLRLLDIDPDVANSRSRLCGVPALRLVEAQGELSRAEARFGETTPPFGPVSPVPLTTEEQIARIANGAGGLDVLIGTTRDEGHAFFGPDLTVADSDLEQRFVTVTGDRDALAQLRSRRPDASARDMLCQLTTDVVFRRPTMTLADKMARGGSRVFAYEFRWSPPASQYGACHCIDLPFVFGNMNAWQDAPMLTAGDDGEMRELSSVMRAAWISFVRDGTPTNHLDRIWPEYTPARANLLVLDSAIMVADYDKRQ